MIFHNNWGGDFRIILTSNPGAEIAARACLATRVADNCEAEAIRRNVTVTTPAVFFKFVQAFLPQGVGMPVFLYSRDALYYYERLMIPFL